LLFAWRQFALPSRRAASLQIVGTIRHSPLPQISKLSMTIAGRRPRTAQLGLAARSYRPRTLSTHCSEPPHPNIAGLTRDLVLGSWLSGVRRSAVARRQHIRPPGRERRPAFASAERWKFHRPFAISGAAWDTRKTPEIVNIPV
jgi:hypothetical protein